MTKTLLTKRHFSGSHARLGLAAWLTSWTVITGCSSAPNPAPARIATPEPAKSAAAKATSAPPAWFVSSLADWHETTKDGIHRGVAGVRFESKGRKILRVAETPAEIDEGLSAPPWAGKPDAPCKYVFWRDYQLYGAADWLGETRDIAKLHAPVLGGFDWFDGVGLMTLEGLFVVHAQTCALEKLDLPDAAAAFAWTADRGLVLTSFGSARQTADKGKTFRDVSRELPNAAHLLRVGDTLRVTTREDDLFVISNQGTIERTKRVNERPPNEPVSDPEDRWPEEHDGTTPLDAGVSSGVVLPDGDAIVTAEGGLVARVQLSTGRATEILRFGSPNETCAPVSVSDRVLILCEVDRRVDVIDAGSSRVERSFDIEREAVWDRFVVADDDALGFVGPCAGRSPAPAVDVVSNASALNSSMQRSPTFCVRTTSGTWVEHQLDAADATDVLAWIPRADGGATALIAVPGTFLHGMSAVEVRGALRVVRVPKNAPPMDVSMYGNDSPKLVSHNLRSLADGSIEGWVSSGHSSSGQMSVHIDAEGRAQQRPLPSRTTSLTTSGRFGLVRTEDYRYFETTDYGRSFQPIDPPPSRQADPVAASPVGSRLGAYLRVGWGAQAKKDAAPFVPENTSGPLAMFQTPRLPPATQLVCRFSEPPKSSRVSDSMNLGLSKQTTSQMSMGRIIHAGAFYFPWRQQLQGPTSANAEFIYISPFDVTGSVRRTSVPMSRLEGEDRLMHELRPGFVLNGSTVWPVATDRYNRCAAPLTDEAGVTVPFGTCLEDPSAGAVIDGRVFLVHPDGAQYVMGKYAKLVVSAADVKVDGSAPMKPRVTNLKTLGTTQVSGGILRYKFAVGHRGKTPIVIAVDTAGNAALAPINPTNGKFGSEETLVALSKLQLGNSPACAERPDDARVTLAFTTEIGLYSRVLEGIHETDQGGVAVLRWSKDRVCLDAIDMTVLDERHEADALLHVSQGPLRRFIVRFDKPSSGKGMLSVVSYGMELKQSVVCEGASP